MKFNHLHLLLAAAALSASGARVSAQSFTPGNIVISTVSDIVSSSGTDLDTASPIVLDQFQLGQNATSASLVNTFQLPQTSSGNNSAISGEYGSASEGILQDSANGQYLTIMGYGVNAQTFNTAPVSTYGTAALGQSISLTAAQQQAAGNQNPYTTVPRVVALIGANGSVDTSTAITGIYNGDNPRSVATVDGSAFYLSGQGQTGDGTGGLFYATDGSTTATPINNNTSTPTGAATQDPAYATETRSVEIVNVNGTNTLMASRDFSPSGTPNDSTDIRSFTGPSGGLPTSTTGLSVSRVIAGNANGNTSSINLTTATENGVNNSRASGSGNHFVYLSPEEFFMASPTVMYVADSGEPKSGSANAAGLGEGGLQKWVLTSGTWNMVYDLVAGLNLVNNANATSSNPNNPGVTGLFGLTGEVVNGETELFATSYGLNELSPSYLYEITDNLSSTSITDPTVASESFTTLYSAPVGTSIRGVAFAPTAAAVPEPGTWGMILGGFGLLLIVTRGRRRTA